MSGERADLLAEAPFDGHPWERQLRWKESDQAYAAFKIFRELPAGDRLANECARIYSERYNRSRATSTISLWRRQYRWDERVSAYDAMLDEKELIERRRQIVRASRKHADRMAKAEELLMEPLKKWEERLQKIAAGLLTSEFDEVDEDGKPIVSDSELIAIGRASLKVVIEAQKEQRAALGVEPPKTMEENTRTIKRGELIRRRFTDRENRQQMEEIAFQVVEEERRVEQTG